VICSTTGQGDLPDNARPFYRQLRKLPPGSLSNVHIAVLGLGDSNYDKFNNAAKMIEKTLVELGAQRFLKSVYADDGIGLEIAVEPWRKDIYPAVTTLYTSGALACAEMKSQGDAEGARATDTVQGTPTKDPQRSEPTPPQPAGIGAHLSAAHIEVAVAHALSAAAAQERAEKDKADQEREQAIQQAALAAASKAAEDAATSGRFIPTSVPVPEFAFSRNAFTVKPSTALPRKPPKLPKAQPMKVVAYPLFPTTAKDEETGAIGLLPPFPEPREVRLRLLKEAFDLKQLLASPAFVSTEGHVDLGFVKQHGSFLRLPDPSGATSHLDGIPEDKHDEHPEDPTGDPSGDCATAELDAYASFNSNKTSNAVDGRPQAVFGERSLNGYTAETPSIAEISAARVLTTKKSHANGRQVLHIEFSLPVGGQHSVSFEPGDCIGLFPTNDPQLVTNLLQRLGLAGFDDTLVRVVSTDQTNGTSSNTPALLHIPSPLPLRELFEYCVDITSLPRKGLLRNMADYCEDPLDAAKLMALCSLEGKALFKTYIEETRPNLLELLQLFPSCLPPLSLLVDQLPPLGPRTYSITNSPNRSPAKVQIAFTIHVTPNVPLRPIPYPQYLRAASASAAVAAAAGVPENADTSDIPPEPEVQDKPIERSIHGVCTHWLRRICISAGLLSRDLDATYQPIDTTKASKTLPGCTVTYSSDPERSPKVRVPIFLRRTPQFKLPYDITTPLILVGPGTGVAPFRAFLQHRESELQSVASGLAVALGTWRGMEVDLCPSAPPARTNSNNPSDKPESVHEFKDGASVSARSIAGSTTVPIIPATAAEPSEGLLVRVPERFEDEGLCRVVIGERSVAPSASSKGLGRSRSTGEFASLTAAQGSAAESSISSAKSRRPRGRYEAFDEYDDADAEEAAEALAGGEDLFVCSNSNRPRVGSSLLFFGCRAADEDAIYYDEFEQLVNSGALTTLHIAFSREFKSRGGRKTYVQDVILAESAVVCEYLFKHKAVLYVCGDGVELPRAIMQTLQACVEAHADKYAASDELPLETPEARKAWAVKQTQKLVKEGRFVTDVWN